MKTSAKHVEVFTFVHRGRTVHLFCADEEEAICAYEAFIAWYDHAEPVLLWLWWVVHTPTWLSEHEYSYVNKYGSFVRTFDTETNAIEYVLEEMDKRSGGGE